MNAGDISEQQARILRFASRGLKVLRWPDGSAFGLIATRNAVATTFSASFRVGG